MSVNVRMDSSLLLGVFGFGVEIDAKGDSQEEALDLCRKAMEFLAAGRETHIRQVPTVDTFRNFDTKKEIHRAYARFTVIDRLGEWYERPLDNKIPSIGLAECRKVD